MNELKIIFAVFLEINCFKNAVTNNIANNVDVNSLDNNYFIIIKKDDDQKNYDERLDVVDKNQNGAYYFILDKNLKPTKRTFRETKKDREERKQAELLKSQQERKVKEIMEFTKDHPMTTNFLYEELQRIKRQRQVKDDLRKMVAYLEKPGKGDMRSKVIKCYNQAKKDEQLSGDMWRLETNNLVVNVQKDPYNYGYIN